MLKYNIKGQISVINLHSNPEEFDFETFKVHDNIIFDMISLDSINMVASCDKNGIIKLNELTLQNELKEKIILNSNSDGVRGLAGSPSDTKLATCAEDKTVRIWDLNTVQQVQLIEGHGNDVTSVAWHNQKALVISGSKDRIVKLMDPISGKTIGNLFFHTNAVNCVKFSLDGNFIYSCGKDQLIRVTDLRTMKELRLLSGHNTEIVKLAVSPQEPSLIASTDIEGKISIWNTEQQFAMDIQFHESNFNVPGVQFDNQGNRLFSLSHDKSIKMWSLLFK